MKRTPDTNTDTPSDIRIVGTTFDNGPKPAGGNNIPSFIPAPPPPADEALRRKREAARLTLEDAGMALKIKPAYLAALESGDYAALPTPTHAKGFLRSYAQYLGLADQIPTMLDQYQRAVAGRTTSAALAMPMPLPEGKLPTGRIITLGLVSAAVICTVWFGLKGGPPPAVIAPPPAHFAETAPVAVIPPVATPIVVETPTVIAVPDKPVAVAPETPVAEAPKPTVKQETPTPAKVVEPKSVPVVTATATPTPTLARPAAGGASNGVVVRAISDSWVEVQDQTGATVYSKLLRAGQEYAVPAAPGLKLNTGNGGGIVILRNGQAGAPLGKKAEVVKGVSLAPHDSKRDPKAVTTPATAPRHAAPSLNDDGEIPYEID